MKKYVLIVSRTGEDRAGFRDYGAKQRGRTAADRLCQKKEETDEKTIYSG